MLSETSEHVLRALHWLATRPPGTAATAEDIAAGARVPRQYMSKILRRLSKTRVLEARRGVGGGYRIGRPFEQIRLSEIVGPFERPHPDNLCIFGGGRPCGQDNQCSLHNRWGQIRDNLFNFLNDTTLADMIQGGGVA